MDDKNEQELNRKINQAEQWNHKLSHILEHLEAEASEKSTTNATRIANSPRNHSRQQEAKIIKNIQAKIKNYEKDLSKMDDSKSDAYIKK